MSFTTFKRLSLSIGALAIALASTSAAQAQSCKDTTECPQGFVCEQYTTPTPSPAPTPAVDGGAAPKASDLPASSGAAYPADIAPATGGACRPAPCTADSQCGAGMVCLSSKSSQCGAPTIACAPGSDCKLPPASCTETIVSTCAYKWQLPCNTDLDCGANFVCNPSVVGSCSGGGGTGTPGSTGASDPGVPRDLIAPAPPDQMCTTTTSFPGYCQPKATTCTADSECPAAWACKTVAQTTPVTDGPTRTPAQDGGTASSQGNSSNAGVAPPQALPRPPEETVKVCVSPLGYGGTVGRDDKPVDTANPGTGNPEPQSPGVPPTGKPATGESADDSPKAGCAVGGNGGSSFALLGLGLVGLALARRRRS